MQHKIKCKARAESFSISRDSLWVGSDCPKCGGALQVDWVWYASRARQRVGAGGQDSLLGDHPHTALLAHAALVGALRVERGAGEAGECCASLADAIDAAIGSCACTSDFSACAATLSVQGLLWKGSPLPARQRREVNHDPLRAVQLFCSPDRVRKGPLTCAHAI